MYGKVSVIIPVYNSRNTIKRCVESVMKQTYKNKEIIIIDDGSTDNFENQIEEYLSQIRIIRQENQGVAEARNRGIEEATGEFITFIDADDSWENVYLEQMLSCMLKEQCDMALCALNYINKDGTSANMQRQVKQSYVDTVDVLKDFFDGKITGGIPGKIFRKDLLIGGEIRFPTKRVAEDALFIFESLLASKKIGVIDRVLYTIYNTDNSLCNSYTDNFLYIFEMLETIKETLLEKHIFEYLKEDYIRYYLSLAKWILDYSIRFYGKHGGEFEKAIINKMDVKFTQYKLNWATGYNEKFKIVLLRINPQLYCWVLRCIRKM